MTEAEKIALLAEAHGLALVFSGFTMWGTFAYFYIGDVFSIASESVPSWLNDSLGVRPAFVAPPIQLAIVLGCLYFMRDSRKPRPRA